MVTKHVFSTSVAVIKFALGKAKNSVILLTAFVLFVNKLASQTWSAAVAAINPNTGIGAVSGQYSQLLVVNGNPAIAHYARGHLYFMRATNASGTAWGTPVTVDASGFVGQYISLKIIDGIPAMSYYDVTNGDLKFVRANDISGNSWGLPITVDAAGDVGQYTSLQTVNSYAAISYYDVTNGDLKYVRATNFAASNWGAPITVASSGNVGKYTSLLVVNGSPAIAYYDATRIFQGPVNEDLMFVRSTDASGNGWYPPVTVDDAGNVGLHASMQIVNGNPAISYFDQGFQDLKYIRCNDPSGFSWPSPVIADGSGSVGEYPSLQIVNGNPAIAYYGYAYTGNYDDLKYVRANDNSGNSWGTPVIADSAYTRNVGRYASLQIVNGNPAVAYHDQNRFNLVFVRSLDASGTAWDVPQTFDLAGRSGQYTSLQIINGNPALAFYDDATNDYGPGNRNLVYIRASDATGTIWSNPYVPDSIGDVGRYSSLQLVAGKPAIAYFDATNNDLKYVRATDQTGINWSTPVTLDAAGITGHYASLEVVNGFPAVAYHDYSNGNVRYIQATDSFGVNWNTAVTPFNSPGFDGLAASLKVINGKPAISFIDGHTRKLLYVRATDVNGSAWGSTVVIQQGDANNYTALQLVNGRPAIAFYDETNGDLRYTRAIDSAGASWYAPVAIDAVGYTGQSPSLQVVNGTPAISYYDITNNMLKYVRATDSTGASWGSPSALAQGGGYTSMVGSANGAAIGYFHNNEELPYFISGLSAVNTADHFRSRQNGNWNDANTWETSTVQDFSSGVTSPALRTPDVYSNSITIRNGHNVVVTDNVSADQIEVNSGGTITINNGDTLSVSDGAGFDIIVNGTVNIVAGGSMTIRSTSSGTASVGTSAGSITGNVTVERYIPDDNHRALRLLTASTTGPQTILQGWQENGALIKGRGTQITSHLYDGTNGFDANSIIPSIYVHDASASNGNSFTTNFLTNTNTARLDSLQGYLIYVYGDRNATPANFLHDPTTLRNTGNLRQGTQPPVVISSSAAGYTLVGNPFASPIDFECISTTANLAQHFYIFDANITGRINIGGLRLIERTAAGIYQHTPILGVPVADNSMRYIHSGQTFLVKTSGSAGNANIVFTEACKSAQTPSINPFRTADTEQQLLTNLMVVTPDNEIIPADGIRIKFGTAYSAPVSEEDFIKMINFSENLASRRESKLLIVEKRPEIISKDTIYLYISNMEIRNYRFQVTTENLPANTMLFLHDNFTGAQTALNLNSTTNVNFSVTANSASSDSLRFKIVLARSGPLPVTITSLNAYQLANYVAVEWKADHEIGIKQYVVERSSDGSSFTKNAEVVATGNNVSPVSYSWLDRNPMTGTNYYRIQSIGMNGEIKFSHVVKVTLGKVNAGISVYPNPLVSAVINLQLTNEPRGYYRLRVINPIGQPILTTQIFHNGGSSSNAIETGAALTKGYYFLEITSPDKIKHSIKFLNN